MDTSVLLATTALETLQDPLQDPIAAAFEFVTLVPQPFWLLLVFAPNWKGTRAIFEPIQPLAALSLAHLLIVVLSTQGTPETGTAPLELFNDLFNTENNLRGVVDRYFHRDRPLRIMAVSRLLLCK